MALYPIRTFGDPVLRTAAATVDDVSSSLERLVEDMIDTMYEAPGVGLAAPQIGVLKRIFVADVGDGPFVMVNPEIVDTSGEWVFEEGCLSVPGYYWEVARPGYAKAKGVDLNGDAIKYEGEDLMGRVLQHEIDHLNGKLLLDRLPKRTRRLALRDLRQDALGATDGSA